MVLNLASYVEDSWLPSGGGSALRSAIDGSAIAELPRARVDLLSALKHARGVGGPALRALRMAERGRILRALAEAIMARKEELYELSFHTGATRSDSWLDIDGGAGALFFYASRSKAFGTSKALIDGPREAISKGNFAGQHIFSPLQGAAVLINAYNFPVWGMLEKLAPALLAGMPVVIKPASATAWLAHRAFAILIDSGALPSGSVQLLLGSERELMDALGHDDVVSFTGSASTAAELRRSEAVVSRGTRLNAEQDSLNACILGPDAAPDTPEFDLFVREVVREMTVKAGQKCTAIRRILVPGRYVEAVEAALIGGLGRITIGDPRLKEVKMGALAGTAQREQVQANVGRLAAQARISYGSNEPELINADGTFGAFIAPTLLRCDAPENTPEVHEIEAFGPVATLMPYDTVAGAAKLARAGRGSLVMSAFTHQYEVAEELIEEAASSHGRLLIVSRENAADSTGHGNAMPHLLHGGPGRAGGGAELGGMIGMHLYMQRTAIQGEPALLDRLAGGQAAGGTESVASPGQH